MLNIFEKKKINADELKEIISAAVSESIEKKIKDEASLYKYIFSEELEKITNALKYQSNNLERLEKSLKEISFDMQRLSTENRQLREDNFAKNKIIGRLTKKIEKLNLKAANNGKEKDI